MALFRAAGFHRAAKCRHTCVAILYRMGLNPQLTRELQSLRETVLLGLASASQ